MFLPLDYAKLHHPKGTTMTRLRIFISTVALVGAGMIGGIAGPLIAGADSKYDWSEAFVPSNQPTRILDTRKTARLEANVPILVTVPIVSNVGVGDAGEFTFDEPALAVAVNLTIVQPDGDGYLTVWPAGETVPDVSNVNFIGGQDEANFAIVKVTDGRLSIVSSVGTDVVVDLFGQYNRLSPGWVP